MQASVPASVSLIVRSIGRAELAEALDSAGAQTHPALEIVVVDATGGRHPPLPSHAGPHPIRFVGGAVPRTRPVAANAGLDASRGEYLGFLDDDDTLLPGHVAGLAGALDAEPGVALAFAMTREVRAHDDVRHVGHARLSRLMLLEACFFPPCAALFRRTLLAHCRFDESLDAAEDWDFWLQASLHTTFRFVPQESAVYRADRGRSAMSASGDGSAERWRRIVASKWAPEREALAADLDAAFDRALDFARRGAYADASDAADRVLELHPFHAGALNLRGTHRALCGDLVGAHADFAEAAAADPDDPVSLFNLAQADERLGRPAEAATLYRRVLAIDPAHPHARARLGAFASGAAQPTKTAKR